jgi:hypothetical protein
MLKPCHRRLVSRTFRSKRPYARCSLTVSLRGLAASARWPFRDAICGAKRERAPHGKARKEKAKLNKEPLVNALDQLIWWDKSKQKAGLVDQNRIPVHM